jgi:IS605 OrfB family transposase
MKTRLQAFARAAVRESKKIGFCLITTWRYRIKDSGGASRRLAAMSRSVNFVWNFCKETQVNALRQKSARVITDQKSGKDVAIANFLTSFELSNLTAGSSKELGLHSQTVQAVCEEYSTRRKQFKKLLRWRGRKSLGWIPVKSSGIKLKDDNVIYCGKSFRFWNSRELPEDAKIKTGSFSQDSRGRWYLNITFESSLLARPQGKGEVGIDLGIKTLATLSTGEKIERPNLRANYLEKLRRFEKTRKFARRKQAKSKRYGKLPKAKQVANLAAKVANKRDDYLHKASTGIVRKNRLIVVGDVSCKFMNRSKNLSGLSLDAGIGEFRNMLRYKSIRDGGVYLFVSERYSTQTCSSCGWQHPKERRIGLGVREWVCEGCGEKHDRDANAARNILRFGREALSRSDDANAS